MKNIGIWIDKEKAHIVTFNDAIEQFSTINSEITNYHITANKTIGGANEVAIDRKYLEREKNQTKLYFKKIVSEISDANAIVIFGPSQMGEKLKKELDENYNSISNKVKAVINANKMTDNQLKAWVRDFFNTN